MNAFFLIATLEWQPVIAVPLLLSVVGGLAAISIALYVRTARSLPRPRRAIAVAGRLALLAGLLVILLGPTWFDDSPAAMTRRPPLAVLIDTSRSMSISDAAETSRLDRVRRDWLTASHLNRLDAASDVQLIAFDRDTRSLALYETAELNAAGDATHLLEAISRTVDRTADSQRGAILVISDGRDTSQLDSDTAAFARLGEHAAAQDVAIFAVPVGSTAQPPDRSLVAFPRSETVFAGESVEIVARISRTSTAPDTAAVTLSLDGRPLDRAVVRFAEGERFREVLFSHTPASPEDDATPRTLAYRVEVAPAENEADRTDNERTVLVRQLGRRMRVVLFEGEPYWDTRFLIAALRTHPRVELTTVQAYAPRRIAVTHHPPAATSEDATPAARRTPRTDADSLPTDAEALSRFDAVVLGRGVERFFPPEQASHLADYVTEHGGGLLLTRGRPFNTEAANAAIAPVVPLDWGRRLRERMVLLLSEAERSGAPEAVGPASDQIQLQRLPTLLAATRVERVRSGAVVLLRQRRADVESADAASDRQAAVVHQRLGRGRTLAVLSEGLWRWAFRPGGDTASKQAFAGLVDELIRWTALGGEFALDTRLDLAAYPANGEIGDPVEIELRTRFMSEDERTDLKVEVLDPTGQTRSLAPQSDPSRPTRLIARYTPTVPGVHRARVESGEHRTEAGFVAHAPPGEMDRTAAQPEHLARLAEASGGAVLRDGGIDPLLEHLNGLDAGRRAHRSGGEPRPAWATGWLFALLLGGVGVEWFVRRRSGLR